MSEAPFEVGDRVFNTGNAKRNIFGIVTKVIDADWCDVLWTHDDGTLYGGKIRRDGSVEYGLVEKRSDRIVRVKLSVRVPAPVISDRHTP